jgi:hypothetical protein
MLGRSAGGDVQRTNIFARALFAVRGGDAPHQTIKELLNEIISFEASGRSAGDAAKS